MARVPVAFALVALALVIVAPASAGDTVTKLLTYEAPTFEAHVGDSWSRGPHASGSDTLGVTSDERVDAGRLFTLVPANATSLEMTVADTAMPFTPIRFEWFRESGASAGGAGAACAPQYASFQVDAPPQAAFLVIWVHATSAGDLGACDMDAMPAGATSGDVVLTFRT